jgi:hypothetical protein
MGKYSTVAITRCIGNRPILTILGLPYENKLYENRITYEGTYVTDELIDTELVYQYRF